MNEKDKIFLGSPHKGGICIAHRNEVDGVFFREILVAHAAMVIHKASIANLPQTLTFSCCGSLRHLPTVVIRFPCVINSVLW